jgi:hypothetical protein
VHAAAHFLFKSDRALGEGALSIPGGRIGEKLVDTYGARGMLLCSNDAFF